MFCDRCGKNLPDQSAFCSNCGRSFAFPSAPPRKGRIAGHIRLLGILWLAVAGIRLIPGLFMLGISFTGLIAQLPAFVYLIFPIIGGLFVGGALLAGITGWGLLTRQPWARTAALVVGGISLMDLPFGTALGIYTLWVLLPAESEAEYRVVSKTA